MTTTYTIQADWPAIHEACRAIDQARRGTSLGEVEGIADIFSGTYHPSTFEPAGLAGLYSIRRALNVLQDQCWTRVHRASARAREAAKERGEDSGPGEWWAIDAPGRDDICAASHRGARWRASVYGGRVVRRPNRDAVRNRQAAAGRRVHEVMEETRAACRVALRLQALAEALAQTGILSLSVWSQNICAQSHGHIHLTGLRWLAGEKLETSSPSVSAVEAFALGEPYAP